MHAPNISYILFLFFVTFPTRQFFRYLIYLVYTFFFFDSCKKRENTFLTFLKTWPKAVLNDVIKLNKDMGELSFLLCVARRLAALVLGGVWQWKFLLEEWYSFALASCHLTITDGWKHKKATILLEQSHRAFGTGFAFP